MQRYSYGERVRCPRSVNRTAGPRTPRFFFFFFPFMFSFFMHSAYAPGRGNPADWREDCAESVSLSGGREEEGPDFIWGGGQEDEWKRYKVTTRIRDELVCNNSHPLLRLWGLVYGIPKGGFFRVLIWGRIWGGLS